VSERVALEAAQARCQQLEAQLISEAQLELLAEQLEREAQAWEAQLQKSEARTLASDRSALGAKVMGFGFALLFGTPIVAIIGTSLSRMLRHELELAWALVFFGLAVVVVTSLPWARTAFAHRVSRAWKLSRTARQGATTLRAVAAAGR